MSMSEIKRPLGTPSRPIAAHAAAVERWAISDVGGPIIGRSRDEKKSTTPNTVDLLRQALQESDARGYQAGLAKAQAESQASLDMLAARIQQLDSILQLLGQPLAQLDADIEKELLHLT